MKKGTLLLLNLAIKSLFMFTNYSLRIKFSKL